MPVRLVSEEWHLEMVLLFKLQETLVSVLCYTTYTPYCHVELICKVTGLIRQYVLPCRQTANLLFLSL